MFGFDALARMGWLFVRAFDEVNSGSHHLLAHKKKLFWVLQIFLFDVNEVNEVELTMVTFG